MPSAVEGGNGKFDMGDLTLTVTYKTHRAPSIIWQFLWNYAFGPYLLWKVRMIHDIYQWRMQTMLAIAAG